MPTLPGWPCATRKSTVKHHTAKYLSLFALALAFVASPLAAKQQQQGQPKARQQTQQQQQLPQGQTEQIRNRERIESGNAIGPNQQDRAQKGQRKGQDQGHGKGPAGAQPQGKGAAQQKGKTTQQQGQDGSDDDNN